MVFVIENLDQSVGEYLIPMVFLSYIYVSSLVLVSMKAEIVKYNILYNFYPQ